MQRQEGQRYNRNNILFIKKREEKILVLHYLSSMIYIHVELDICTGSDTINHRQ